MKSTKIIASLLALNLACFAGILFYFLRTEMVSPVAGVSQPGLVTHLNPAVSPSAKATPPGSNPSRAFSWAQLESEDYKTYIARLRAIGCPEQTIRDIIIADLDKLLAPEIRTAYGRRTDLKFWHPEEEEMLNDVNPRDLSRKEREIDKRKREIIHELVNADLVQERMKTSGVEDYYERRLGFISEDKRSKVREVLEKFDEAEQAIRDAEEAREGSLSAADRAQIRVLRQQRAAEVEGLLSPREQPLYELWLSPVANEVRHATYGMNATEEEFMTIYQARKAFDDTWGLRDSELLDPATRQQMEQARQDTEDRIHAALGDERYAQLVRGQDDDFHLLSALVTRFNLPKEKAGEVYGYKTVTLNYRQRVMNDPNLTPQQKEEAQRAITEETRTAVRGVLGLRAYSHYVRSGQGQWMSE